MWFPAILVGLRGVLSSKEKFVGSLAGQSWEGVGGEETENLGRLNSTFGAIAYILSALNFSPSKATRSCPIWQLLSPSYARLLQLPAMPDSCLPPLSLLLQKRFLLA